MKAIALILVFVLFAPFYGFSQTDKEALSLKISKAEDANLQKLKEYVWKRKSQVFIESQLKLTTITEFSFTPDGKLDTKIVDAESTVKKKPGLRGAAQANAAEDKMDYIEKALGLALQYTFLTKGEMLDFFSKATVTEKNGQIEAVASDVKVPGDRLLLRIDPTTYLCGYREFSSLLGKDKLEGELNYEMFSNGTNHISTTTLDLPAKKMTIDAQNQDYTIRVK
ncbi:hypothetical protein WBG78_04340 [Chryseolinea sp. T2]|uniref:hypothetical protein n=1 Tax=Chryseolinea sp. T2 TaxID=3129255 RepID=UPI0030774074